MASLIFYTGIPGVFSIIQRPSSVASISLHRLEFTTKVVSIHVIEQFKHSLNLPKVFTFISLRQPGKTDCFQFTESTNIRNKGFYLYFMSAWISFENVNYFIIFVCNIGFHVSCF